MFVLRRTNIEKTVPPKCSAGVVINAPEYFTEATVHRQPQPAADKEKGVTKVPCPVMTHEETVLFVPQTYTYTSTHTESEQEGSSLLCQPLLTSLMTTLLTLLAAKKENSQHADICKPNRCYLSAMKYSCHHSLSQASSAAKQVRLSQNEPAAHRFRCLRPIRGALSTQNRKGRRQLSKNVALPM